MHWLPTNGDGTVNLQSTLSSATADGSLMGDIKGNHHPITCSGPLYLDEDNTMRCEHATAPSDHPRNQAILDATIAILIFQEVGKRYC